jgi:ABC-type multidrug transport system ATPase subunit
VLDIDRLEFVEGERVLVGGENGSGKSTLLRVLSGAASADAGRIEHGEGLVGLRVGYVPQSGGLYSDLTVRRNLALRRSLYGCKPLAPEDAWYVDDLVLAPHLDRQVGELSGGFQRLAAFAAALHVDPGWLLLDEPFEGLDAAHRDTVLDILRRLAGGVRLIVIAAPNAGDYPDATRVVELRRGQLA